MDSWFRETVNYNHHPESGFFSQSQGYFRNVGNVRNFPLDRIWYDGVPFNCRSRSPIDNRNRRRSPTNYRNRSRSATNYRKRSRSAANYRDMSRSPINYTNRSRSPTNYTNRSRSPTNYTNRSRSPISCTNRSRSPINCTSRSRSPINHTNRSRVYDISQPSGSHERISRYNPRLENSRLNLNRTLCRLVFNARLDSDTISNDEQLYSPANTWSDDELGQDSDYSEPDLFNNCSCSTVETQEKTGVMYGDIFHDKIRKCPRRKHKNEIKIRIYRDNIRLMTQRECEAFMFFLHGKINQFSTRNQQIPYFFDTVWNNGEFTMKSYQYAYEWLMKTDLKDINAIKKDDIKCIQVIAPRTHSYVSPNAFLECIKSQNNLETKKWYCNFSSSSEKCICFNFELDPISSEKLEKNPFLYYGVEKLPVAFIE